MADKQKVTSRYDPRLGRFVEETEGKKQGSTTDYQDTSPLAVAARAAEAKRKKKAAETQAEALEGVPKPKPTPKPTY